VFSNKDYISYFKDIENREGLMIERAMMMDKNFPSDKIAGKLIAHWLKDEKKHKKICQNIEAMIESKYN